jgi:hypothetical protein
MFHRFHIFTFLMVFLMISCFGGRCSHQAFVATTQTGTRAFLNVASECTYTLELEASNTGRVEHLVMEPSTRALRIDVSPERVALIDGDSGDLVLAIASDQYRYSWMKPQPDAMWAALVAGQPVVWKVAKIENRLEGDEDSVVRLIANFDPEADGR